MGRSPLTIGWMVVAVLSAAGCTSSPWSAGRAEPAPGAASDALSSAQPAVAPVPGTGGPTSEAMDRFTAEFQQLLGELDPPAREQLLADLQRTDRDLWPEVVYRFRALAAYRNRAQHEDSAKTGHPRPGPPDPAVHSASWSAPGSNGATTNGPSTVDRLPVADNTALPPPRSSPGNYPNAQGPSPLSRSSQQPTATPGVVPAGYQEAALEGWQAQVSSAAATLESQIGRTPKANDPQESARQAAEQARLRMLYLLAGRRDDAIRPIPMLPPSLQDFWSKQLFGLATWLDTSNSSESTRAAATKQILDEAVSRLGESAPLTVRNAAFCTKIVDYGRTTPFGKYEFVPGQEVLLYAEVENFSSESTPDGFQTSLKGTYAIFDSRDRKVDERTYDMLKDRCQNTRRDFFIILNMNVPDYQIYPGSYTLVLTIEDLNSGKVGQSSIPFTVKQPKGK